MSGKITNPEIYKYSQLLSIMVKFTIVNSGNVPRWRSGYAVDCRSTTTRFDSGPWLGDIMSIRVQKTFEALFALEEVRGLFRESLPTGFDAEEEAAFSQRIADLKAIIADLEAGTGTPKVTKIAGTLDIRSREEQYINIHPIQAAGRLTTEARKAIISYGDGYSTCDACRKPFRLDKISKPGIAEFHEDLAKFAEHGCCPCRAGCPTGIPGSYRYAGRERG